MGIQRKPPYRKWVGVVLGLLLDGSAHFLSGHRAAGVKWYFSILGCSLLTILVMAIPGIVSYAAAAGLLLLTVVLFLCMLVKSFRPVPRIGVLGWIVVIVLGFGLYQLWSHSLTLFVRPFKMPTNSMAPTLVGGDHLYVETLTARFRGPELGDVIVFRTEDIEHPNIRKSDFYVKRVAGVPGDRVRINPPNLIINDRVVTDPPTLHRIATGGPPHVGFQLATANAPGGARLASPNDEIILGDDEYFVLGDNTRYSLDSRYFGPITRKSVVGIATRVYWPLDRISQPLGRE